MTAFIVIAFVLTYLGMATGRVPGTRLDRTGIALLAAFALLVVVPGLRDRAGQSIDVPTLLILASLMTVSGELELAGFYDRAAFALARLSVSPRVLLLVVIAVVGGLSALLTNDVVVFALTPMLIRGLRARGLDPRPFVLAAAAASNAGSAATIIGNPQNVLIAEVGHLGFRGYAALATPIAVGALLIVWLVIAWAWRLELAAVPPPPERAAPPAMSTLGVLRGGLALAGVLAVLLAAPRPAIFLGAIGTALLVSRVRSPRELLARIDIPLLLLFVGLFVVTGAISSTGLPGELLASMQRRGADPGNPLVLIALCVLGSNTIGNVPLVALVLAIWHPVPAASLPALAIFSTLAGNLLVTGSVANLIVLERSAQAGARVRFADHARVGVPITLLSMAWGYAWLRLFGAS